MPSYETYGNSGKARCELFGEYLVENKATVRQTAKYFGMSKSTVHKDVTSKLRYENPILFKKVNALLQENKAERHLRGGEATKRRYENEHITELSSKKSGKREKSKEGKGIKVGRK